MKYNKRTFIIVGLILGLLCGVLLIIKAYTQFPSLPEPFELCIQILILGFLGAMGLALGLYWPRERVRHFKGCGTMANA